MPLPRELDYTPKLGVENGGQKEEARGKGGRGEKRKREKKERKGNNEKERRLAQLEWSNGSFRPNPSH